MSAAFNLICNLTVALLFVVVKNSHPHSHAHLLLRSISQNDSATQIVRDENKNSSFVTTNLNSFVCACVPRVDSLCVWQLFVPVFCLPGLLINVWRWDVQWVPASLRRMPGSALLTNVNVWVFASYRKSGGSFADMPHLGSCGGDAAADALHFNTRGGWLGRLSACNVLCFRVSGNHAV